MNLINKFLTFIYSRYWAKYFYYSVCSTHRLHEPSCNRCKCIKWHLHSNVNWYRRVYERDGFKCVKCGGNKPKLDAHHIFPLSQLVKKLTEGKSFVSDKEKYDWLIQQPEILDLELTNGITLCRVCHKKEHKNWGSHNIL